MCRLARAGAGGWVLNAIGDVAQGPRDYGTWLPELKGYRAGRQDSSTRVAGTPT